MGRIDVDQLAPRRTTQDETGHRVVAQEEERRRDVRTVVVANATYVDAVAAQCAAVELRVELEYVGDQPVARKTEPSPRASPIQKVIQFESPIRVFP